MVCWVHRLGGSWKRAFRALGRAWGKVACQRLRPLLCTPSQSPQDTECWSISVGWQSGVLASLSRAAEKKPRTLRSEERSHV